MSEWPEKYAFDVPGLRDVDFVKREDFDRLLDCFAKTLWHSNGKKTMPELKEMILNQIRNEGENNG